MRVATVAIRRSNKLRYGRIRKLPDSANLKANNSAAEDHNKYGVSVMMVVALATRYGDEKLTSVSIALG
jgi:hypothetical protein